MEVEVVTEKTVDSLVQYKKNDILKVNHEYQRGLRWSDMQKKMFIDSIFRGYSIPAFYFHKKELLVEDMGGRHYEIVDGQQRVDAIFSYSEGYFPLLDPYDKSSFRFPNFVKNDECPWGGKRFNELSEELKKKLLNHKIVAYEITTNNENEIRDLFIRLQGGTPLTPQDKRDSWPGNFTNFVLRIGGKTGVDKWYGLPLFKEAVLSVQKESNRRELVAGIFMLLWEVKNEKKFCDLKSNNIDEFYHRHVNFDENSMEAKRFEEICRKLYHEVLNGKPKIKKHHFIHLFLLVDSLLDEDVRGTWETKLAEALHKFETRCSEASEADKRGDSEIPFNRYFTNYVRPSREATNSANHIQRRHAFFATEITKLIPSLQRLDPQRDFTEFERGTVFFRDFERCQYCQMNSEDHKVSWAECEIHHVTPHTEGGTTTIDNAALVHKDCHPKSREDVSKFSDWWSTRRPAKEEENKNHGGRTRHATKRMKPKIQDGRLIIEFKDGETKEWKLPEKHDKQEIRRIRDESLQWARGQGATQGQEHYIMKALNGAGYRLND